MFGNIYGVANTALFLIIVNYIAALVAVQLLRGDFIASSSSFVNFGQVWNSFLAMYQVSSSENWPTVLYGAATAEIPFGQAIIALIFIAAWFLFANCELSVCLIWFFFLSTSGFDPLCHSFLSYRLANVYCCHQ